jgi:hypothetical protein
MMQSIQNTYGVVGAAMMVGVVISSMLRPVVRLTAARGILLGIAFVVSIIPFGGISLVELLRGATGDIAISTFLFCVMALTEFWSDEGTSRGQTGLASRPFPFFGGGSLTGFFIVVLIVGCVFYLMTMGFTVMDPYAWGYSPRWMLPICRTAASLVLIAVGAYALRLMESTNLWDYLLDPILFLVCLVVCIAKLIGKLRFKKAVANQPQ